MLKTFFIAFYLLFLIIIPANIAKGEGVPVALQASKEDL
jgi:hypothetical protein